MSYIIPQKNFILAYVKEHLAHRDDISDTAIIADSIINDCLIELVKIQMRDIAGDTERLWPLRTSINILDEAINDVGTCLAEEKIWLGQLMSYYEEPICAQLKYIAKEMETLYEKLQNSRQNGDILERQFTFQDLDCNNLEVPFELISIGSPDNLDGLVVKPLIQSEFRINIDLVADIALIQGQWFPYDLIIQELVFVIDDDGTLFISTENFPETLLKTAYQTIQQLAMSLYKLDEQDASI
ncbi:MAG: hypothetical protein B0A82_24685 [Alkalinema sp. CACIAM 70d]|nr:MAG: hypothetical protein B0A82_24685 [Alkalinema sp. CACIAM 70d]